jgi:hypothetical protein
MMMTIFFIVLTIAAVGIMLMLYSVVVQLGEIALALRGANLLRDQIVIELSCLTAAVSELEPKALEPLVCAQTSDPDWSAASPRRVWQARPAQPTPPPTQSEKPPPGRAVQVPINPCVSPED